MILLPSLSENKPRFDYLSLLALKLTTTFGTVVSLYHSRMIKQEFYLAFLK